MHAFLTNQIADILHFNDNNREAVKIAPLSTGKINKYEYLKGEEILSCSKSRVIEQPKFTYFPLGQSLEKQTKIIKAQGKTN